MSLYASIDDNILMNYPNYSLSQLLYYAVKESAALEGNSRMTAMDSVSKNVGEMIDKLTMSFNRIRQHFFACFNFLTIKTFNNDEAEKEKKTSTIPRHIKMMEGNLSVEELHLFSESSSQMILNIKNEDPRFSYTLPCSILRNFSKKSPADALTDVESKNRRKILPISEQINTLSDTL